MAYTETLLNGAIDDHQHREQFLHRIAEQGDRLNNLIHDMLALARIEGAQQKLEITALALEPVVRQCVDDYSPLAESKQITLSVPDNLPQVTLAAETEGLRTILNNLIDNAIKYTPNGGRVEVRWHDQEGHIRIEVADTGLGIPRAEQLRIFERFYRVDRARSQQVGSTGLGLSIVKHLVQAMHGTVGVESTVGKGSTFWVRLPAG
jgi:two-component system phosphate regulon sensor histidine kinase PhoR